MHRRCLQNAFLQHMVKPFKISSLKKKKLQSQQCQTYYHKTIHFHLSYHAYLSTINVSYTVAVSQSWVCTLRRPRTSKTRPPKCTKGPPKCVRCSAFTGFPNSVTRCFRLALCRIATVREERWREDSPARTGGARTARFCFYDLLIMEETVMNLRLSQDRGQVNYTGLLRSLSDYNFKCRYWLGACLNNVMIHTKNYKIHT